MLQKTAIIKNLTSGRFAVERFVQLFELYNKDNKFEWKINESYKSYVLYCLDNAEKMNEPVLIINNISNHHSVNDEWKFEIHEDRYFFHIETLIAIWWQLEQSFTKFGRPTIKWPIELN